MKNKIFTLISINPNDIIIKERARKDLGDLTELKDSITKSGLLNPILITQDNVLIAGERRLTAIKELELPLIDARISPSINSDDAMIMEMMENVARKDFTWAEEITLKLNLHKYWVAEATKENKIHGYRATAEKLSCSIGTLSTDLVLAKHLPTFPDLITCETKIKAKNTLKKMGEQAEAINSANDLSPEEKANLASMMQGNFKATKTSKGKVELNIPKAQHEDTVPDCSALNDRSKIEHQESNEKTKLKKEVAYSIETYDTFINKIPNNSVGLIELDPPYAIDFNTNYGQVSNIKAKANDWTVEQLYSFYKTMLPVLFDKLLDSSWIICWTGKEHWLETNKIAEESGFKIQPPGIWAKSGGSTNTPKTNMISNYEMFLLFRKGKATFNTPSFPAVINFNPPSSSQRIHQWEKPLDMYKYIISALGRQGSLFLSPFAGSGNSLIAATHENMIAMGCDESQKYIYGFMDRFNGIFNS